jgi:hypothetical protein
MIAKVNYNQTYQSLQPLWVHLTNTEGMITKVNYNTTYQSLQPFCQQLTNLEGMITWVNYNQMNQSQQPLWLQRSTSPYNLSTHSPQIWADGFKRCS